MFLVSESPFMRSHSFWLFALALTMILLPQTDSAQGGSESAMRETRLAIFPVVYGQNNVKAPLVAPYLHDIHRETKQAWNGSVLAQDTLTDAMALRWVSRVDNELVDAMLRDVTDAEKRFQDQSAGAAIPTLEKIIAQADALLPHTSARLDGALGLLRAHLLLWWALEDVGERERLPILMAQAAERFPNAQLNGAQVPPFVSQAFETARKKLIDKSKSTLVMRLEGASGDNCRIALNGLPMGDWRNAALPLPSGRTYYVQGGCGDRQLPPRRVIVNDAVDLVMNVNLADHLLDTNTGHALRVEGGSGSGAEMARLGTGIGQTLEVGNIVMVGVVAGEDVLQLDRVRVFDGVRTCSVRLSLTDAKDPAVLYGALRAVVANRPTRFNMLFAGEDGIYRTPEDYVENVIGTDRVFTWVFGGMSVLTLGSAIVFEAAVLSKQEDLNDCGGSASCRGTNEIETQRPALENTILTRNVLYGATGALAAGALLFYFLEAPDVEAELDAPMKTSLRPWMAPSSVGLGLEGRW